MFRRGLYYGERCFDSFTRAGFLNSPIRIGFAIAFMLLISYLIYRMLNNRKPNLDQSLDLLKLKYVSGEISEEEYIKKSQILNR